MKALAQVRTGQQAGTAVAWQTLQVRCDVWKRGDITSAVVLKALQLCPTCHARFRGMSHADSAHDRLIQESCLGISLPANTRQAPDCEHMVSNAAACNLDSGRAA